jgi:predicted transcriptional regulator
MIDREHNLPITKQAEVLRISRGSVYYLPRPVSAIDLEVMRRLDRVAKAVSQSLGSIRSRCYLYEAQLARYQ